jgi:hypothetical protein
MSSISIDRPQLPAPLGTCGRLSFCFDIPPGMPFSQYGERVAGKGTAHGPESKVISVSVQMNPGR